MYEVIRTYQHHNNQLASYVRVKCDTDFVGRNEEFLEFCDNLAMGLASLGDTWGGILYEENPVTGNIFIQDVLDARKKFGEDIRLLHYEKFMVWEDEDKAEAVSPEVNTIEKVE